MEYVPIQNHYIDGRNAHTKELFTYTKVSNLMGEKIYKKINPNKYQSVNKK